ncbi:hypothetical protein JCM16163A_17680 [Paenibacillus sp. YK5]|nr:hypothetical protein PN4B1_27270 [Paenibacillus naphthalenovorans]
MRQDVYSAVYSQITPASPTVLKRAMLQDGFVRLTQAASFGSNYSVMQEVMNFAWRHFHKEVD